MSFDRDSLRHAIATLAYRAAKTMRGAPSSFADFRAGPTTKTPVEIVAHMGDLLDWGLRMLKGQGSWTTASPGSWDAECDRFFKSLEAFDDYLAAGEPILYDNARIFQGPIADALTHTGQLAMLRRLHGAPLKGESYNRADIVAGRVGSQQALPDPRFEFD